MRVVHIILDFAKASPLEKRLFGLIPPSLLADTDTLSIGSRAIANHRAAIDRYDSRPAGARATRYEASRGGRGGGRGAEGRAWIMTLQRGRARKSRELIRKYHRITRRGRLAPLLSRGKGDGEGDLMQDARADRRGWIETVLCLGDLIMYALAHLKDESWLLRVDFRRGEGAKFARLPRRDNSPGYVFFRSSATAREI